MARPQVSKQGRFRASEVGSQGQEAVGASETPRHLALTASHSQDTVLLEATAPAEESSRKTELQVEVTTDLPALISLNVLIRLEMNSEQNASRLSYGSRGNLLYHSNAPPIYSDRLC